MNKKLTTACAIASVIASWQAFGQASTPSIDWKPQDYSFVEVNLEGSGSYNQLVKAKDEVNISIKWNAWSGTGGNSYKVYFDDMLVNEGELNDGTQSGVIEFPYKKSGRHTLTLALCDSDGCAKSAGKPIVIADTDGGHLAPLTMDVDANNKDYAIPQDTVVGSYFVEWGIYDRDFDVSNIPAKNLTHLLYGFIPICGENKSLKDIENGNSWRALELACGDSADYEVVIHDPWAAVQKALPGIATTDPIRGTYAQLMALKQRYPDLKILPSVGGWTLSDPFHGFTTKANRDTFVASVKKFLKTWKFYDGVDIDWEFPGGSGPNPDLGDPINDGPAYVALMQELRAMLDELEAEFGREYQLTSAIGVGYDKIEDVDYGQAIQHMDYIFAMSYDFFGGWNNVTGHQTGIYCGEHLSSGECDGTGLDDEGKPRKGPAYTTDNGIQKLLAQGVPANQLVVGTAMYGRGWEGVYPINTLGDNPMTAEGTGKLTGTKENGVWEPGIQDYKGIKKSMLGASNTGINGFEVGYDEQAQAAYAWNRTKGTLVSYDSPRSVNAKGAYVRSLGLAGLFAWEIDADNGDILNAMHEGLAGGEPDNYKPVVSLPSGLMVNGGESLNITATASDRDNDPLTYSWDIPAELQASNTNNATVSIVGTAVSQDTDYLVKVSVSDGKATVSKSVTVTVKASVNENNAPVVESISDISINEGASADVSVVATDADNDALSYTWHVPQGLTLQGQGANITLVGGSVDTHVNYSVAVTVSDGQESVSTSFNVQVLNVTDDTHPPVVEPIADVVLDENTSKAVTVNASDPDGNDLTYSWSVPAGLSLQGSGSSISLMAGEVTQGTSYTISVTVSDGEYDVVASFSVLVKDTTTGGDTTWDADKVYNTGDKVKYNGVEYRAKWWSKGDVPGAGDPWEEVIPDDGQTRAWSASSVYNGGDKVTHQGDEYQAKWWTQGQEPGVADVWKKL
ncbi:glycosyl hydrolase family 18 protein [Colwelliaceae bacterium 6441]